MARGRRTKYVKKLTSKDVNFLKQMSRTGMCSRQQVKKHLNMREERLIKLKNSGFIKAKNVVVGGSQRTIFMLNSKGKEYCKNNLGTSFFAKVQSNHIDHDLKLTEMYYNMPENVRETWKSENEIVYNLKLANSNIKINTCIDATVVIDNVLVGVESIGSTYTDDIIKQKEEIAKNVVGCSKVLMF